MSHNSRVKSNKNTAEKPIFLTVVIIAWVFVLSLTALNVIGAVPYYVDGTPSREALALAEQRQKEQKENNARATQLQSNGVVLAGQATSSVEEPDIFPERILIPAVGVDLPVANPHTTDIAALDKELLTAVVRYPGSGAVNKDGNILIFGHSTGYRRVHNQLFKAFNALKTLEEGNYIKLRAGNKEYIYVVNSVTHERASNVRVDFATDPGVRRLTLSTCDSFGAKDDRYIVVADFIGEFPITDSTTAR